MAKAKRQLRPKARASKPKAATRRRRALSTASLIRSVRAATPATAAAAAPSSTPTAATSPKKQVGKSHQQPSLRTSRTWTPRMLRVVERVSDSGNMEMLGDLCDQLLADERIRKAFETVVGGLLSLDLTFEASGDGRRRGRAVKALEADEDWWAAFPESELQQFLTLGRLAGVSWGQLRWQAHLKRIVPRLEPWDLRHFRYDWQKRQWFVKLDGGVEQPIAAGDGQWVCYMPYGSYRPWAYGLWRGLAPWWLLKKYAISDWGRTGAVGASYVATPREGADLETSKEQRDALAAHMYALSQEGGVLVLPNGFELKVVEAMANTARNYGNQISASNTAIDIAIQGQNLTSEVEGGSRAAATVHAKVETRIIRNVGSTSATCLHDQALIYWASYNFGDASIAPWPVWDTEPPEDTTAEAEGQKRFGEAIKSVQDAGYEVLNVDELAEKHGLKIKKAEPKEPEPVPDPPNDDDPPPAPGKTPATVPKKKGTKPKHRWSQRTLDDVPDEVADDRIAEVDDGRNAEVPTPQPKSPTPFVAALASGAPASKSPGFVAGQLHVDAIVEHATEAATEEIEKSTLSKLVQAIDDADSLEDMRERVRAVCPDLDPTELSELVYRAMVLGEMTGRFAVSRDA